MGTYDEVLAQVRLAPYLKEEQRGFNVAGRSLSDEERVEGAERLSHKHSNWGEFIDDQRRIVSNVSNSLENIGHSVDVEYKPSRPGSVDRTKPIVQEGYSEMDVLDRLGIELGMPLQVEDSLWDDSVKAREVLQYNSRQRSRVKGVAKCALDHTPPVYSGAWCLY